ncbi:hypothetical protein ACLNGM_11260 [Aureimonas phyllosphaerae]|uniref:hypothetical protein n=1 Tax=Aureimonas phyllosphaerae TaxID=1166078 RepID=UPI003A5C0B9E
MSDTHPLTFLGAVIAAGGWVFLMLGTAAGGDEYGSRAVFNMHKGMIAENVIHLGYVVALAGVIASVGSQIRNALTSVPQAAPVLVASEPLEPVQETSARLSDREMADRAAALRSALDRSKNERG